MTATLEQIHNDPEIIDRAISRSERLDIVSNGVITGTFTPAKPPSESHNVLDIPTCDVGPMRTQLGGRHWVGSLAQAAISDEHSMDAIRASIAKKREAL